MNISEKIDKVARNIHDRYYEKYQKKFNVFVDMTYVSPFVESAEEATVVLYNNSGNVKVINTKVSKIKKYNNLYLLSKVENFHRNGDKEYLLLIRLVNNDLAVYYSEGRSIYNDKLLEYDNEFYDKIDNLANNINVFADYMLAEDIGVQETLIKALEIVGYDTIALKEKKIRREKEFEERERARIQEKKDAKQKELEEKQRLALQKKQELETRRNQEKEKFPKFLEYLKMIEDKKWIGSSNIIKFALTKEVYIEDPKDKRTWAEWIEYWVLELGYVPKATEYNKAELASPSTLRKLKYYEIDKLREQKVIKYNISEHDEEGGYKLDKTQYEYAKYLYDTYRIANEK